jgi:hypothetical protein
VRNLAVLLATTVYGCRFPDDWEQQTFDERDSFKRTRFDIEDVLRDCSAMLGPTSVLTILTQQLKTAATGGQGGQVDWRGIEAAYHCMGALKDERLEHGNQMVLEVCIIFPFLRKFTHSYEPFAR